MAWWQRLFGGGSDRTIPDAPEPFMEHPKGQFVSSVTALEDAVRRLRELPNCDQWITFSAQGQGETADDYQFAEVRMMRDMLQVDGPPLDVSDIVTLARVGPTALVTAGPGYSIAGATAAEASRVLDAIYRHHFGIRPFEDEGDDYAVGAEW